MDEVTLQVAMLFHKPNLGKASFAQVFSLATDKDFDFKLHFFLGVC